LGNTFARTGPLLLGLPNGKFSPGEVEYKVFGWVEAGEIKNQRLRA